MKRFFVKLLIFALPLIVAAAGISLLPLPAHSFNLAFLDKQQLLARTPSPRLVFAGGSNCAFGIDSERIAEAFAIPVVNLGLNMAIGLGRILDAASPLLREGDILVIIPEYEHFTGLWNGKTAAYELILSMRQYRFLPRPGRYGLPRQFPIYLKTLIQGFTAQFRPPNPLAYRRDQFNRYGDYAGHLEIENQDLAADEALGSLDRRAVNRFFRMAADLQARGIRVFLSYPGYEAAVFDRSAGLIQDLDRIFRERLRVISRPGDYRFPRSLFYDTVYHLNAAGRSRRTEILRRDLEQTGVFPDL
ncbi:MAG: hypothetical protein LBE17_05500 [Treponema sp.]|jgi:hypothetical protein|nr:hypothetical protein [Treponema sp.]